MASPNDSGSGSEYSLRDDDRGTPYTGSKRRYGYGPVLLLGLLVVAAFLAYGVFHRGEVTNQSKPEATVGSTR
jgi:hypothetical protein